MSMEYIRKANRVPAKRGGRIRYHGNGGKPQHGTITGAVGGYLKIRLDGDRHSKAYHPTWEIDYLDSDGKVIYSSTEAKQ